MINYTALRIGNFVNYHNDNTIFEVTEIQSIGLGVKNKEEDTWIELDQFSPIALSEDWLIQFGFEKHIKNNNYAVFYKSGRMIVNRSDGFYDYGSDVKIETVHQLQNFFFALCIEELTII